MMSALRTWDLPKAQVSLLWNCGKIAAKVTDESGRTSLLAMDKIKGIPREVEKSRTLAARFLRDAYPILTITNEEARISINLRVRGGGGDNPFDSSFRDNLFGGGDKDHVFGAPSGFFADSFSREDLLGREKPSWLQIDRSPFETTKDPFDFKPDRPLDFSGEKSIDFPSMAPIDIPKERPADFPRRDDFPTLYNPIEFNPPQLLNSFSNSTNTPPFDFKSALTGTQKPDWFVPPPQSPFKIEPILKREEPSFESEKSGESVPFSHVVERHGQTFHRSYPPSFGDKVREFIVEGTTELFVHHIGGNLLSALSLIFRTTEMTHDDVPPPEYPEDDANKKP